MTIIDLKKEITFYDDKIYREMLADTPEMRIALMCLEPGQSLEPHKAPLSLQSEMRKLKLMKKQLFFVSLWCFMDSKHQKEKSWLLWQ